MFNTALGKAGENVCTRAFTVTFSLIYIHIHIKLVAHPPNSVPWKLMMVVRCKCKTYYFFGNKTEKLLILLLYVWVQVQITSFFLPSMFCNSCHIQETLKLMYFLGHGENLYRQLLSPLREEYVVL